MAGEVGPAVVVDLSERELISRWRCLQGEGEAYEGVEGGAGDGEGGECLDVEVADDEDEEIVWEVEQAHRYLVVVLKNISCRISYKD